MNEMLRKRIELHLENLSDEQGYQLLDYVEFLEEKYGTATRKATTFERFTDGVEDALRAGRIPATAIRETMRAVDSASRLMHSPAGHPVEPPSQNRLAETRQRLKGTRLTAPTWPVPRK